MKKIAYDDCFSEFTTSLADGGAFLTVKSKDGLNTMTIGWATIGISWSIPVLAVLVRKSRFTYQLIERAADFTVSVPFADRFKEELAFCGSESGRDYNKFKECDLQTTPALEVETPIIKGCQLFYECEIKYQQAMEAKNITEAEITKCYPESDLHTIYYGKIVASYLAD